MHCSAVGSAVQCSKVQYTFRSIEQCRLCVLNNKGLSGGHLQSQVRRACKSTIVRLHIGLSEIWSSVRNKSDSVHSLLDLLQSWPLERSASTTFNYICCSYWIIELTMTKNVPFEHPCPLYWLWVPKKDHKSDSCQNMKKIFFYFCVLLSESSNFMLERLKGENSEI